MKKINENDYIGFVLECPGFMCHGTFKNVMRVFEERAGKCTVYGIKPNGDRAVIESKV